MSNSSHQQRNSGGGVRLSYLSKYDHVLDEVIQPLLLSDSLSTPRTDQKFSQPLKVFDQGPTSMCVACSGAAVKHAQEQVTNLSPFFLYNLRDHSQKDAGMSVRNMLTILYKLGIPTVEDYPIHRVYVGPRNAPIQHFGIDSNVLASASRHKIKGYGRIYSVDTLIAAFQLNRQGKYQNAFGGFSIVLPDWNDSLQFWQKTPISVLEKTIYHCTTLIDVDRIGKRLLLQNSWSENWGHHGTTWLSFDDFNHYMAECFYSTSNQELADTIRQHVQKRRTFRNFGDGDLDSVNIYQGSPTNLNFVTTVSCPNFHPDLMHWFANDQSGSDNEFVSNHDAKPHPFRIFYHLLKGLVSKPSCSG